LKLLKLLEIILKKLMRTVMSEKINFISNPKKNLKIEYNNKTYLRIPIKTHVITKEDNIVDVVKKYALNLIQSQDILFITEKAVAITQGRAFPVKDIKPRKLAKILSHFVTKTPAGIGLGIPETMEMALRECGVLKILFAALIGGICKLFGIKGIFYKIAGYKASSIDGPTPNTLPPYNKYVVLGPENPDLVCKKISDEIGIPVVIVDLNDLGGKILGKSNNNLLDNELLGILKDNPLGQSCEQTPLGIIRELK